MSSPEDDTKEAEVRRKKREDEVARYEDASRRAQREREGAVAEKAARSRALDDAERKRHAEESHRRAREDGGKAVVLAVLAIALAYLQYDSGAGYWAVGTQQTYIVQQAIEWNWRARATNNLVDMATNINRSLELLAPLRGNPKWWWPTPDTDFDQIKLNMVETRDTALAVARNATIGSVGYHQAVQNLQETIVEINAHLAAARGWLKSTQTSLWRLLAYLGLLCLAAIALDLTHTWDEGDQVFLAKRGLGGVIVVGWAAWAVLAAITP